MGMVTFFVNEKALESKAGSSHVWVRPMDDVKAVTLSTELLNQLLNQTASEVSVLFLPFILFVIVFTSSTNEFVKKRGSKTEDQLM